MGRSLLLRHGAKVTWHRRLQHGRYHGLVLAGGAGQRMLGADKGLIPYRGRPMVTHAIDLLERHGLTVTINHNRSDLAYAAFKCDRIKDAQCDYQGPLVAMYQALLTLQSKHSAVTHVVIMPCDTPDFSDHGLQRLLLASHGAPDTWVVAKAKDGLHPIHGVFPLCRLAQLEHLVKQGERRLMRVLHQMDAHTVNMGVKGMKNINHLRQLR